MSNDQYIRTLDIAAKQYKLSLHVNRAAQSELTSFPDPIPQRIAGFQYGGLTILREDLELLPDDMAIAGSALEHCATFILAVAVDTALEATIPNRFAHIDADVVTASRIARVIRNAFSHNPFMPRWNLSNANHIGRFEISDVITVDTTQLNGADLDWRHYGGPLALLKFLRHCQMLILSNTAPPNSPAYIEENAEQ